MRARSRPLPTALARRFTEGKVLRWFDDPRKEIAKHPLLREQALGESP
jgi:hypothetical protein